MDALPLNLSLVILPCRFKAKDPLLTEPLLLLGLLAVFPLYQSNSSHFVMVTSSGVVTSSDNPSNLPPRYEIRQLTQDHVEWVRAILLHSNMYHSPIWPLIYPEHKSKRIFDALGPTTYLIEHQIASGMSIGIFDTEYKFKRPESEATGGALYWNELKDSSDATSEELLERMDFPLASIALAYDGINAIDMAKLADLMALMPLFGMLYHVLDVQDQRGDTWKPTKLGQVLMRNATSTRVDYEGEHLMGNLARFMMREAKLKGYTGIQIECAHDAVTHVWTHPPPPFKAEVISKLDMATYEEEGKKVFWPSKQVCAKVFVSL